MHMLHRCHQNWKERILRSYVAPVLQLRDGATRTCKEGKESIY